MLDRFDRDIRYLRISVTDRCNLRCAYCMPKDGIALLDHADVLRFEEIRDFTAIAVNEFGFDKVRLTGGEPLVRKHLVDLIAMLRAIGGIKDFALTTNGILLSEFAQSIKDAGIMRINVSLDTIDRARYEAITCGGDVRDVLRGLAVAINVGFSKIKLNCVVRENSDEPDARSVAAFAKANGFEIRYITQMDIAKGTFKVVEGGTGGDCAACTRMRLTSNGLLYPCLFNDMHFSLRELGAREALRRAIDAKPERGECSKHNRFNRLGG
jgi:cyclic pyranopterin phosphate synthase